MTEKCEVNNMSKTVRIIALILAILMGLSAIGMIAMYVSAETYDGASVSASVSSAENESDLCLVARCADLENLASNPIA